MRKAVVLLVLVSLVLGYPAWSPGSPGPRSQGVIEGETR